MVADDARIRRLAWVSLLLVPLAWGTAVVRGGFSFDDRAAIIENPVVAGALSPADAFRRDYWHHRGDAGHYRPLATLSLRIDHALFGDRARGYHLTNVLLHLLVVAVLAWTLGRLEEGGGWALLGLMVFAVHPALADSVAWISGRTSMLGALGGAVALAAIVGIRRLPLALVGSTFGLLCGLLAKEDTIVFALPLLLLAWRRSRGAVVAVGLSIVSAVAAYLLMRAGALGTALPSAAHAPLADLPLVERLHHAGRGLLEGARLLVLPARYPPNYRLASGFCSGAAPTAWAWLGWGVWLALVVGGTVLFWRGRRRGNAGHALVGASTAMTGLALLPVLQIVPAGVVFAPRFLYLPLLFGAPALGALLRRLPEVLFVVLLAALVVGAWARSGVYASEEAYQREILEHVPNDVAAWNALGLALEERRDLAGARQAWWAAVQVDPGHSRTWSNLGRLAIEEEDYERAENVLRRAVAVGPKNAVARMNLGSLLLRTEHVAEAERYYAEAATLQPGRSEAWRGLGHARLRRGDLDGAEAALRKALQLAPGDARARALLADVERRRQRPPK